MRSRRLTLRPLTPKAAITGDANPSLDHDGFRPIPDMRKPFGAVILAIQSRGQGVRR